MTSTPLLVDIGKHRISVQHVNSCLTANVLISSGGSISILPASIFCGVDGTTPHPEFIQRVGSIARERLQAFVYPSVGLPQEVWLFEATNLAAPAIMKAKENLKLKHNEKALEQLETALKLEQQQKGDIKELTSVILKLKKETFLHRVERDASFYLSSEEVVKLKEVIQLYQDQENPFSLWSQYLEAFDLQNPIERSQIKFCSNEKSNLSEHNSNFLLTTDSEIITAPILEAGKLSSEEIAQYLWLNPEVLISESMVQKVNTVAFYLERQGFELIGVQADGNCYCRAFLKSYQTQSHKIPILEAQENKLSYLRGMIASQYKASSNKSAADSNSRARQIEQRGEWVTSQEGDLLTQALSIPIRTITVNEEQSVCGISDMVTFAERGKEPEEWSSVDEAEKPKNYILMVDLGGHFVSAQRRLNEKNRKTLESSSRKDKEKLLNHSVKKKIENPKYDNDSVNYLYYLSACLNEHEGKLVQAAFYYLYLGLNHPTPLLCLKKTAELVSSASDPLAFPHLLERLDRDWLIQLSEQTQDSEIKRWVLLKEALRMTFEDSLVELGQYSPQPQTPTCFICFNVGEPDVGKWLEQTLVLDLDRVGLKPLFSRRDSNYGDDLDDFQGLIRDADQVILICTPDLKKKCDERKKAPTGVAAEVRLARDRYKDESKWGTIFPLYLKGDEKSACPSVFFKPIFHTKISYLSKCTQASVFSYFAEVFELFGAMRKIPRDASRKMKEIFIAKANKVIGGDIDLVRLELWRKSRASKVEVILKSSQERVSQKTQMINLPEALKDFTGRKQELIDLQQACRHKSRVALTGLGGVGKTALALKYADDDRAYYQFIHFMPAGTSQLVIDGLLKLADDLHVPKTDKVEERLQWLKTTLNRFEQDYLLIFDGLDQVEAFEEVAKYLPERSHCLLITTRMPQQSKILGFELLELRPLTLEEAVSYLLNTTGAKEESAAKELVEKLGRLPLALTHAARYIDSQKISIQKYLELFNQYELELFSEKRLELGKEEKTILTTWNISMLAIEEVLHSPIARNILEMLSFLGQSPIPQELIERWFIQFHREKNYHELRNALRHLCNYSIINSPYPDTYDVHLLVQSVIRFQMSAETQNFFFQQALMVTDSILNLFKEENPRTWNIPKLCIPHVITLLERQHLKITISIEKKNEVANKLALICQVLGNVDQALKINQKFLSEARERQRQYPSAEGLMTIAVTLNNVGEELRIIGKPQEALNHYQEAFKIWIRLNCLPDIAKVLNNIGLVFTELGKPQEALSRYDQALEIWKELYGETHPARARSLHNKGAALQKLGKAEEALNYYQQTHRIWKSLYGDMHPDIVRSLNNIGSAFFDLGKAEEAKYYHSESLKIGKSLYDKIHPDIACSLNNMGQDLLAMGKTQEALEYFQQSSEMSKQIYGEKHLLVAVGLNSIGMALIHFKKADKALEHFQRAHKIFQTLYVNKHPSIAASLSNIGLALKSLGKTDEAIGYYLQAFEIRKSLFGENHPEVAESLNNLGSLYHFREELDEALKYFFQSLEILKKFYKHSHPSIAAILNNIGSILQERENLEEALRHFIQARQILQDCKLEIHPNMANVVNNIASVLRGLKKREEALEAFRQCLKIRQQLHSKPDPDLAHTLYSIGSILLDLGQPEEALKNFQKALKVLLSLYDKNHSDVAKQLFISSLGPRHPLIEVLKKDIKALNRFIFFYNILIKIERFFLAIWRFFTTGRL